MSEVFSCIILFVFIYSYECMATCVLRCTVKCTTCLNKNLHPLNDSHLFFLAGVWCWCHWLQPPREVSNPTRPWIGQNGSLFSFKIKAEKGQSERESGRDEINWRNTKTEVLVIVHVIVGKAAALIMFGKCFHPPDFSSSYLGFLQKNNNLEERSRIVSSFKERTAKNLLSCDNSGGEARFRRTETDFSNLYARGRLKIKRKPVCSLYFNIIIIY